MPIIFMGNVLQQLVDLARSFVEPEEPHVPVQTLDAAANVRAIARATEDLHGAIGNPARHFRREQLAD